MEKTSRRYDTHARIERLEQRHMALKEQIRQLDSQRFLSSEETQRVYALKKARLAAKDELTSLTQRTAGG